MHTVNILFSAPNTIVGAIIRKITKKRLSHCSIFFDNDITELYSCCRAAQWNLLSGRCGREKIENIHRKKEYVYEVISIEVSDQKYEEIRRLIKSTRNKKYDYPGLFMAWVGKHRKNENLFLCSTYVAYLVNNIVELPREYYTYKPNELYVELSRLVA